MLIPQAIAKQIISYIWKKYMPQIAATKQLQRVFKGSIRKKSTGRTVWACIRWPRNIKNLLSICKYESCMSLKMLLRGHSLLTTCSTCDQILQWINTLSGSQICQFNYVLHLYINNDGSKILRESLDKQRMLSQTNSQILYCLPKLGITQIQIPSSPDGTIQVENLFKITNNSLALQTLHFDDPGLSTEVWTKGWIRTFGQRYVPTKQFANFDTSFRAKGGGWFNPHLWTISRFVNYHHFPNTRQPPQYIEPTRGPLALQAPQLYRSPHRGVV